jgi:transcriptional regulator with XRE-family HTH domain
MALSASNIVPGLLASLGVPKDSVGRRMRVALAEQDLEDQVVARLAHVSAAWLGSVKQNQVKNPATDKLRSVANVLGKPTSYFTAPLGYVPVDEVEDGLLIALDEDDREFLGRIVARLSHPPEIVQESPRRRVRSSGLWAERPLAARRSPPTDSSTELSASKIARDLLRPRAIRSLGAWSRWGRRVAVRVPSEKCLAGSLSQVRARR